MLKRLFGNQLVSHASIYLGATLVSTAIPFLMLPLLTRWLGPAEFGVMGTFLALVGVLAAVIGLATNGLIGVVYFRDGEQYLPSQIGASVAIALVSSLFWLGLVWILRGPLATWTGIAPYFLWAIVIAGAAQFLLNLLLAIFQTLKRPFLFGVTQFGYSGALATATISLVSLYQMGWIGRAFAQISAAVAAILWGFGWLTRSGLLNWQPQSWPIRSSLAFGLPLLPHTLSAMAMVSVDRLALSSRAGPIEVGYYYAAFQIAMVLTVAATALNQAWPQWLYERLAQNDDQVDRAVVRATYVIVALLFMGAIGLALLADWIVPAVVGDGFEASIPLLRVLALAAACNSSYLFVTAFLFYEQKTGTLSMVTLSAAILQTVLSFALVAHWGSLGVAWATLASAAFYLVATWVVANRVHPMPWLGRRATAAD